MKVVVILILYISIPTLFIFLVSLIYSYHKNESKKKFLINILKNDTTMILSNNIIKDKTSWLKTQLNHAGIIHLYSELYFILVIFSFSFICTLLLSIVIKSIIILSLNFFLLLGIPFIILKAIISKRKEEFNKELKLVIEKLTSMMKSGAGFEHSLQKAILASKSKLILNTFNIYLKEKNITGEEKCFQKMFEIIDSKEFRIFYLVISIGKQSGGKFSNTLERLTQTLKDQEEIKQQIISSTQEIKIGTYMIIVLIILIYLMLNESLNGKLNEHFLYTEEGSIQLFLIIIWILVGLFLNNLISRIKE
ncbi:type II secretion system F family protein [Malaciobacter mytili]|uniref:type II secretion system F family protein n=1 Tax=Malaciobacter mytili TaxID=603050 RepID=UPI0013E9168E|nr:type II secretion system F family protein [Malaciobacter mytili]